MCNLAATAGLSTRIGSSARVTAATMASKSKSRRRIRAALKPSLTRARGRVADVSSAGAELVVRARWGRLHRMITKITNERPLRAKIRSGPMKMITGTHRAGANARPAL